jgi:AcrR family transcriptional regulator
MYHMGQTPRERLLEAVTEHLAEHGLGDTTLRGLAAAVGTSHRMLSYHFGSRARLLSEVSKAVEQRQRVALAAMLADPDASPIDVIRGMWQRIADPSLHPQERLFFELYARALQGGAEAEGFLPEVVEAWIEPSAQLFARLGLSAGDARAEARLSLAVARGLLLDLLATGDRAALDAAVERYVARFASDGVRPLRRSAQDPQERGEGAT